MKHSNIYDAIDYFLDDNKLKAGMTRVLEITNELKMKPALISINTFKCAYKGKKVIHFSIGGRRNFIKNCLVVGVEIADKDDLEQIILSQPDDVINEFMNREKTHCVSCKSHCDNSIKIKIFGNEHHFCSRYNYMCSNPTPEQFKMIEKFVNIRIDYINSKAWV